MSGKAMHLRRLVGITAKVAVLAVLMGGASATPAEARGGWWISPGPYWGWGWGWNQPWGYTVVYPMGDRTHGALDIDVSPERAEIYIDGERVGEADDFDGFPDYLWLEKGTYDVVIFHPGFETIARQISIYAGQVIDIEDRMTPGQEVRPEDLVSRSTERRDERLRRDRENEEEVLRREGIGSRESRPRRESPVREDRQRDALDARGEPGRAVLRVTPDDASVYLDGRFLGTGRELARLRSGLIVDAGEHEIEVVRPGHQAETREFTVAAGEEIELELVLEPESD